MGMRINITQSKVRHCTYKRLISHVFIVLFFVAQLNSLTHQVSHLTQTPDNSCTQCIVTPDLIAAGFNDLTVATVTENSPFKSPAVHVVDLLPNIYYSSRAPPVS
jgi:hypothetical protein